MADVNVVVVTGNLTRDSELRYAGETAVCNFGIAVNRWNGKAEEAQFFNATIFGKQAESLHKILVKGLPVCLDGELRRDTWENNGERREKYFIAVSKVKLYGRKEHAAEQPMRVDQSSPDPDDQDEIPFL